MKLKLTSVISKKAANQVTN